ncbi:MAG: hypothetical protein ACFFD4_17700 [Candidatus Odinarchaeota archaeon]
MTIKFDNTAIQEAEDEYKQLNLTAEQKMMVESLVRMLGTRIPMRHLAMKGFAWRTIQKWQMDNHITIAEIPGLPPMKRLAAVKNMVEEGKKTYLRLLRSPEMEHVIIEAFDEAFKQYQEMAAQAGRK